MDSVPAFCHACDLTFHVPPGQGEALRCIHCQGEFVEFVSEPTASFETYTEPHRVSRAPRGDRLTGSPMVVFPEASVSFRFGAPNEHADNVFEEAFRLLGPFGHPGRFSRAGAGSGFAPQRTEYGGVLERLVDQLSQLHQPARTPASTTALRTLERELICDRNRKLIGETCVVCHDCYKANDAVVKLPCGHVFHEDCVMPWFTDHNTCPVCRYALPTSSQEIESAGRLQQVEQPAPPRDTSSQSPSMDSLFGLFRGSSESPPQNRASRSRSPGHAGRTFDNPSFVDETQQRLENRNSIRQSLESESEVHLRESIISAQDQLRSLDHRLTEQLEEHRRLQDQIQDLQDQRQVLRQRFSTFQNQGIEAVNRLESFIDNRHQDQDADEAVFSRLNQVAGRLRNLLNRSPSGVDNASHYSSSNSSGHETS